MQKGELIRILVFLGFSIFLGGLSLIIWKIPFQIAIPVFHEIYLVPANGHLFSWLVVAWFLLGGYKTAIIMSWDKNEEYFQSLSYRLKALAFVPVAPITKFKSTWYKLPSVEYMNDK
jgi:hypothetical protein